MNCLMLLTCFESWKSCCVVSWEGFRRKRCSNAVFRKSSYKNGVTYGNSDRRAAAHNLLATHPCCPGCLQGAEGHGPNSTFYLLWLLPVARLKKQVRAKNCLDFFLRCSISGLQDCVLQFVILSAGMSVADNVQMIVPTDLPQKCEPQVSRRWEDVPVPR